jgi:DNA-directed RNA polymerase specialized sigma24 family protein
LGLPEISRILDTNLSTSKSRLRLAREKLQSRMADFGITGASFGVEDE